MGDDRSLLVLDALWDIYILTIHYIRLSKEKQADQFLTYPVPELNTGETY